MSERWTYTKRSRRPPSRRLQVDELVRRQLGALFKGREEVISACVDAAHPLPSVSASSASEEDKPAEASGHQRNGEREIIALPSGGGGVTIWDGALCLFINTANTRPCAGKYRNAFWREPRGPLRGSVLMT